MAGARHAREGLGLLHELPREALLVGQRVLEEERVVPAEGAAGEGEAGVVHDDREFIAAQIFPDIFNRVEFARVARQRHENDVARGDFPADLAPTVNAKESWPLSP